MAEDQFLEVVLWRQPPVSAEKTEVKFLRLCGQYHNLDLDRDIISFRLPEAKADKDRLVLKPKSS
jgi:hypothetical protein